jgi:hypothetical protein
MRFRLRTLLIVMGIVPVILAGTWIGLNSLSSKPSGSSALVIVAGLAWYALYAVGLGYAIACGMNAFLEVITKLRDRR